MRFVYILECADNTLYTGITTDINRREEEHNFSEKWAKYTKSRRPVKMIFYQECESRSDASKKEYAIKQLTRIQKFELISWKREL